MDASTNIDNEGGRHNIYVPGGTGVGATIYLQNLQAAKFQLQQLGANAVYVPESNSLVLLQWVCQTIDERSWRQLPILNGVAVAHRFTGHQLWRPGDATGHRSNLKDIYLIC